MRKICRIFLTGLLAMTLFLGIGFQTEASHPSRLVDQADLLDAFDEAYILEGLDRLSDEYQFDIVIVTVPSTEGKSSMEYADDFYDYNGYGMGEDKDGVLLLVAMAEREWYISTTGYGIKAINDGDIDEIGEEVAYYLSNADYSNAFSTFASMVVKEVEREIDRETLTVGEIIARLILSVVIGLLFAFIPISIMKKKMNNVEKKIEAADYIVRDRVMITEQRDLFLYQHVSRTKKPENNSSTHRGSSGMSHGGGGGRF